ncbi:MAG: hypothetical protein GY936_00640 [Ignavibacteriae bacterium]|nr:hypothetical protein [Ignavibacteriota bacterium]
MELHYETSLSAYILLKEVETDLNITETPQESRKNGNFRRILKYSNRIIERRYPNQDHQIKLKTYIENIFFQD